MNYLIAIFITVLLIFSSNVFANGINTDPSENDTITVQVRGTTTDARFEPAVVQVEPGDVLSFVVREGLHTVTAYHPENRRPRRIPEGAAPFDSGALQRGESWLLQINHAGVFDYFCRPHENMGHAGRILSGHVERLPDYPEQKIPQTVLKKLNSKTTNFFNKQHQ